MAWEERQDRWADEGSWQRQGRWAEEAEHEPAWWDTAQEAGWQRQGRWGVWQDWQDNAWNDAGNWGGWRSWEGAWRPGRWEEAWREEDAGRQDRRPPHVTPEMREAIRATARRRGVSHREAERRMLDVHRSRGGVQAREQRRATAAAAAAAERPAAEPRAAEPQAPTPKAPPAWMQPTPKQGAAEPPLPPPPKQGAAEPPPPPPTAPKQPAAELLQLALLPAAAPRSARASSHGANKVRERAPSPRPRGRSVPAAAPQAEAAAAPQQPPVKAAGPPQAKAAGPPLVEITRFS